jgi:hypothetical protein
MLGFLVYMVSYKQLFSIRVLADVAVSFSTQNGAFIAYVVIDELGVI